MTLVLNQIPGFSDLPDANLVAGALALGIEDAMIASNAAFGMVRLEVFQGIYIDGDTVILPVSPVDGYNYSRDELTYTWALYNTDDQKTGWITGPDSLWYAAWLVDQTLGVVSCEENYRTSANPPKTNKSSDGQLLVWTIAQRLKADLTMAELASFNAINAAALATDAAYSQDKIQGLNRNSKFGVVSLEAIWCGEFVTGDTIAAPISPIDNYQYRHEEITFLPSWRWTCLGTVYVQPALSLGQLGPMQISISAAGVVTLNVSMFNSGLTNESTFGRISVIALCQRSINKRIVAGTTQPWPYISGGQNAAFPIGAGTAPVVLGVAVQAGDTITITATGTVVYTVGGGYTCGPNGEAGGASALYGLYATGGNAVTEGGLLGAFTDDAGDVVQVVGVGASVTLTVPVGATRFSLGINTSDPMPHTGYFVVNLSWSPMSRFPLSNDFVDVSVYDFMPGQVLKASDLAQISLNANESALTPEVFGPVTKMDGDTISLPVSEVDGYTYARSELAYFWEWEDTTPTSSGHTMRSAILSASINNATGVCSVKVYNLADGGPIVEEGPGYASIRVVVMAMRQQQVSFGSFTITQVIVNGATSTYLGVITGGAGNEYAGLTFDIAGFVNAGNNTTIKVLTSTNATLVCATSTQVNETIGAATAANSSSTSAPSDAATTPADQPAAGTDQVNGV